MTTIGTSLASPDSPDNLVASALHLKSGIQQNSHSISYAPEVVPFFLMTHIYPHWRRQWHPTPVLLPGKSHGRRSLGGCSPWGR